VIGLCPRIDAVAENRIERAPRFQIPATSQVEYENLYQQLKALEIVGQQRGERRDVLLRHRIHALLVEIDDLLPVAASGWLRRTVSVLEAGRGRPILMAHGLGATKASFLPTVSALAEHHRCIAMDLPGFGDSDKPLFAPYDAAFFSDWMAAVADHLELRRSHVVGHSMGGRAAIEFFQKSIQIDPGYAPPYAGLGDTYASLGSWENGSLPPKEAFEKGKAAAAKALEQQAQGMNDRVSFFHIDGADAVSVAPVHPVVVSIRSEDPLCYPPAA